jgi:hypothetical protein
MRRLQVLNEIFLLLGMIEDESKRTNNRRSPSKMKMPAKLAPRPKRDTKEKRQLRKRSSYTTPRLTTKPNAQSLPEKIEYAKNPCQTNTNYRQHDLELLPPIMQKTQRAHDKERLGRCEGNSL